MRRLPVVLTVAAALAVPTSLAAPAAGAAAHQRPVVRISVAGNHHVKAPARVQPGIAELHESYEGVVGLVQPKHGTGSAAQVARAFGSTATKALLAHYRFVAILGPGRREYARLRRGTLYVANLGVEHVKAADVVVTAVSGAVENASMPVSRRAELSPDHLLHMPGSLSKISWLHLENRSAGFGFLWTLRVPEKVSDAKVTALLHHPSIRRFFAVTGGPSAPVLPFYLGPNSSAWVPFPIRAGRYVTAVIPRESHLRRGQVRETVVH